MIQQVGCGLKSFQIPEDTAAIGVFIVEIAIRCALFGGEGQHNLLHSLVGLRPMHILHSRQERGRHLIFTIFPAGKYGEGGSCKINFKFCTLAYL